MRTALFSVVAFVLAFAVVLLVGTLVRDDNGPETDTLNVAQAINAPSGERVAVRGFVFYDEATGVLLCSERTDDDPPACEGAVMQIENLDPNRLDLLRPDTTIGAFDAYSSGEVALLALKLGVVLEVEDVLR